MRSRRRTGTGSAARRRRAPAPGPRTPTAPAGWDGAHGPPARSWRDGEAVRPAADLHALVAAFGAGVGQPEVGEDRRRDHELDGQALVPGGPGDRDLAARRGDARLRVGEQPGERGL